MKSIFDFNYPNPFHVMNWKDEDLFKEIPHLKYDYIDHVTLDDLKKTLDDLRYMRNGKPEDKSAVMNKVQNLNITKQDIPMNVYVVYTQLADKNNVHTQLGDKNNKDYYTYEFVIPGISKEQLSVRYDEKTLVVSVNDVARKDDLIPKRTLQTEFPKGCYREREVRLVTDSLGNQILDTSNVIAKFENGILSITFARKEVKPQKSSMTEIKL